MTSLSIRPTTIPPDLTPVVPSTSTPPSMSLQGQDVLARSTISWAQSPDPEAAVREADPPRSGTVARFLSPAVRRCLQQLNLVVLWESLDFGLGFAWAAALAEAVVVVPTMLLAIQSDLWLCLLLRALLSIVRLWPAMSYLFQRPLWWISMQLFLLIRAICRRATLVLAARSGADVEAVATQHPVARVFTAIWATFHVMFQCSEVRLSGAFMLDMWYLLGTPLNSNAEHEAVVLILIISNLLLCFGDTVMLLAVLASKSEASHYFPEVAQVERLAVRPTRLIFNEEEATESKMDPMCIICLSDFLEGEEISQLPCRHVFHSECIEMWLTKSVHCPLRCQRYVPPQPSLSQAPVEPEPLPPPHLEDGLAPLEQVPVPGSLQEEVVLPPTSPAPAAQRAAPGAAAPAPPAAAAAAAASPQIIWPAWHAA
eukprot:TRINITY_DN17082_c0_g1_i1.p1 TRINITY_DN17082_c0_g1~~TRINITY_DN17082_c0_g1_i1.p1  ORF type:complete len:427 (+),score=50.91 TRINITY_DN17082_c0_g1_i1:245-1525(+)